MNLGATIPPTGRKRGRPLDSKLQLCREMFPLWSERTIARYKAAMERFLLSGATPDEMEAVLVQVRRRNGSIRVDLLERYTRVVFERWVRQAAQDVSDVGDQ